MFTHSPNRRLYAGLALALFALFLVRNSAPAQVVSPTVTSENRSFGPPPYYGFGGFNGGGGWGWGNNGIGSTAAGSYLGGLGEAIRAQGQYNLMSSEAAINLQEAARRDIENREQWTKAYFEMRKINKAYRDASRGPQRTNEDWIRLARDTAPQRLSEGGLDPVTGSIAWPKALQAGVFNQDRQTLDNLFAERAEVHGAVGLANYSKIRATVDQALATLKAHIRDLDPQTYLEARTFLTGLAREADFPSG